MRKVKYTHVPKEKHAKAVGENMRISTKSAAKICAAIRKKPLTRARRLLQDLSVQRRSLGGKYYTKTVNELLMLLQSCEKNADFLGLDVDRLMVHASAHKGTILRRRRRKSDFGSRLKSTNVEIMLVERGKGKQDRVKKEKVKKQTATEKEITDERKKAEKELAKVKEKTETMKKEIKAKSEEISETWEKESKEEAKPEKKEEAKEGKKEEMKRKDDPTDLSDMTSADVSTATKKGEAK